MCTNNFFDFFLTCVISANKRIFNNDVMKNKRLIIIILLGIVIKLPAQIKFPSVEILNAFKKSKTYIVLEDVMFSDFNSNIKEEAKKHWKITSCEVIPLSTFEKINKQENASFLMVVIGEYTGLPKNTIFNVLTLMMGHKSGDVNKMPEILSVPLSYYSEDGDEEDYGYKLGGILKGMQYAVENILSQKITITNVKDILNTNKAEVKTKELWITKNDLSSSVNTIDKIKQHYPYKVAIKSEEEIQKAVDNNQNNVVIVHKVGNPAIKNSVCLKIILDCSDGKIYYGDFHSVSSKEPDGLLPKDFKALGE